MAREKSIRAAALALACLLGLAATACRKSAPVRHLHPAFTLEELKQQRLDWNMNTLVEAYNHAGYRSSIWDDSATRALKEFARGRSRATASDEPWMTIVSTNAAAAVQAGCNDPMVNYLYIKFAMSQARSKEDFTAAYFKVAQEMSKNSYPDVRKLYAALRAIGQYSWANNYPKLPPEYDDLRQQMDVFIQHVFNDTTTPGAEVYDACHEYLELWKGNQSAYDSYYNFMEPVLFRNWPDTADIWLLKGEAYINRAWSARGGGYANTVTADGWKTFKNDLATAEDALNQAWELDPTDARIAVKMMWLELGQGQGRKRMETWFDRAMNLDPNDYDACNTKLLYLEPKWYGSIDQMLSFGRECVTNTQWGGKVPLVLVDAHVEIPKYYLSSEEDKANYWKQPQVWPDISAAYERFFEANPDAVFTYHNYARYAYKCEQWDKLNELIPKLGDVSYEFFGGREEFDKMVRLAKQHAGHHP